MAGIGDYAGATYDAPPQTMTYDPNVAGVGADASFATIPPVTPDPGSSIQDRFLGALRNGGLTNPNGLGAVAAYAQRESGYAPSKITGSWSDPSESGSPGQSGGILSWRADRLDNMRRATAGASDPVTAQAQFLLQENPRLTQALQNASSPEEAHRLMADAWKFAGYNRPGGENAARLATTQDFVQRLGGGGSIGSTYGGMGGGASSPTAGYANPATGVGSTAGRADFRLGGIQASGAPVAPEAAVPGTPSLGAQPMTAMGPTAQTMMPTAAAPQTQQSLLQKLMANNSLSSLGGAAGAAGKAGQQQGQQKQGGMQLGQPYRPSPMGLQQAKSLFDPSRFYQALQAAGVRTGGQ